MSMPSVNCNKPSRFSLRSSPILTRSLARKFRNQTATMAQAEQTMKHEIFTNVVNIPKFSGEPDDIDLDNYIAIVETYLINKGIKDKKQKIEAFKANIHPVRGTARTIIRYINFIEDFKTYKE